MKKIIYSIIIVIICFPIAASAGSGASDIFIIGKIEFIGKNGKEGIVVLSSPDKTYLLDKGISLLIKRGNEQVILKIDDIQGKYLRCVVNEIKGSSVVKYGEDVYYSESINGSVKYRDAKKMLVKLIRIYEDFILKIESTEEPAAITETVRNFTVQLDTLIPELKRIHGKYPELKKSDINPPAELQNEFSLLEMLEPRLRDSFYKIKIYDKDENVKKAIDELQKVLIKMNAER